MGATYGKRWYLNSYLKLRKWDFMISYSFLAIFIWVNAFFYLLIHIPIDILTLLHDGQKTPTQGGKDTGDSATENPYGMSITIVTTLYFWVFFIGWPISEFLGWHLPIEYSRFTLFYGAVLQYFGLLLIGFATIIACSGRIARGRNAISRGIPNKLTTSLGYRIVRHPLYASYCYYFLGIPLAMQNYLFLPLLLGIVSYYHHAKKEEQLLVAEFGQTYKTYQQEVGMLIPCIGKRPPTTE